ncbi:MAG: hypothetical protein AAGC85_16185 [Bacteroidota bacterium]
MKKLVIVIFIFLVTGHGFCQESFIIEKNHFYLEVEFYPAFIPASRVIIGKNESGASLSFSQLHIKRHHPKTDFLIDSLRRDSSIVRQSKDQTLIGKELLGTEPVYIYPLEEVDISENLIPGFFKSVKASRILHQKSSQVNGSDGVLIYVKYVEGDESNIFANRAPQLMNEDEFQLIEGIFELFSRTLTKEIATNYVEHLEGYFFQRFPVKKISEDPLGYRFYDGISILDTSEFYSLIRSLPSDKPILLDFSNFRRMGTFFYKDFRQLIKRNPFVYWLVNDHSRWQIREIGVKEEFIFFDRSLWKAKSKSP